MKTYGLTFDLASHPWAWDGRVQWCKKQGCSYYLVLLEVKVLGNSVCLWEAVKVEEIRIVMFITV